jgi:hypothetical protein
MHLLAAEIRRGAVLYRDVTVDAPFPAAFYVLAAWFGVAGESVHASRLLIVAGFGLLAALVVRLGAAVAGRAAVAALAVLVLCYRVWAFPHWQVWSYSALAAIAMTGAAVLCLRHARTGGTGALVAAGLAAGGGILAKQDYGLAVTGALGLWLLARPWLGLAARGVAPAAAFSAGVAALVVPAAAYFAAHGALGDLVAQTFTQPLAAAARFDYPRLPPLRPLLGQDAVVRAGIGSYFPSILLTLHWDAIEAHWLYRATPAWDVALKAVFWAPLALWLLAAATWGAGLVRRARGGGATAADDRRLLVLAWAGGFLLAFNRPRDWVHLMMVYPPVLALGAALAGDALGRVPRGVRTLLAAAGAVALLAAAGVSVRLGADLRARFDWPLRMPRGGVSADASTGPIIEDVVGWVDRHAPPGQPAPVYPTQPMLEFLAGRRSVAGYHVIWPLMQDPRRDAEIVAALERERVETVVYSFSQYAHLGAFRDNAPALYDHLVRRYRIDAVFSRERFGPLLAALARRPAPDDGRDLLDATPLPEVAWPFGLAQAAPVTATPAPVRVAVALPPGAARLRFGYVVHPDRWLTPLPAPVAFAVDLEADTGAVGVFRATLDPARRLEDRRWAEADVDLSRWAGRAVTLAFAVTSDPLPPAPDALAAWAGVRVVAE